MFERSRRRAAALAALLALALSAGACSDDSGSSGSSSGSGSDAESSAEPTTTTATTDTVVDLSVDEIGRFGVGKREETFVDSTRSTPSNDEYPGAPDRTVKTTLYYPTDEPGGTITTDATPAEEETFPLVLFSHGYLATGPIYELLLREIVSAGYVVAAPDYPLSNGFAPGGPTVADVGEQPADASFVIDQVLALNDDEGDPLAGLVDLERIGAAGHSLGAITTFALVYSECCTDDRVDAAVPMSGIAGVIDAEDAYFVDVDTPMLAVHGSLDDTVPYQNSVDAFEVASPPKFLLTFVDGDHIAPYLGGEAPGAPVLAGAIVDFFDAYLKDDPEGVTRLEDVVTPADLATLDAQP